MVAPSGETLSRIARLPKEPFDPFVNPFNIKVGAKGIGGKGGVGGVVGDFARAQDRAAANEVLEGIQGPIDNFNSAMRGLDLLFEENEINALQLADA